MLKFKLLILAGVLAAACSSPSTPEDDVPDSSDVTLVDSREDGTGTVDLAVHELVGKDLLDLSPVDEVVDVPTLACEPGEGCFLDHCDENGDCQSGWCVQHLGESVCTQLCQEECPPGWTCQQVAGTIPDVVYICVSDYANLCRPCAGNLDCTSTGGAEDACLDYGLEGSFCGGPCAGDDDCPWGFACEESLTVEGVALAQCVAETGVCPCTDRSAELGLSTPCERENDYGVCQGKRACTAKGLSPCDAAVPEAESCNGIDDDCDGEADEPTLVEGEYIELCDDGNDCTDDACMGEQGCTNTILDEGSCDDGNPCTVADHCEAGICTGKAVNCDDENPCTDDSCTEDGGCLNAPNEAICDDGDPCTVADRCAEGDCSGTSVSCECQENGDCGALEDGDLCNGTLVCDTSKLPHLCVVDPATVVDCPQPEGPDAPCLTAACDGESGACSMVAANEGGPCDTGNACSAKDTCVDGLCSSGPNVNCNDGNPCTDDSCDPGAGCQHVPNTSACNDGDVCTTDDTCNDGACVGGPALGCDDGNACNGSETCDSAVGCVAGEALVCDDSDPCNGLESCDPQGGCQAGTDLVCDDGNPCTDDSCDGEVGCVAVPNDAPCDDGNACTVDDACVGGACEAGLAVDCGDDNVCTDDACDPKVGCVYAMNKAPCDDADICTLKDVCNLGECVGSQQLVCDDDNPCTTDSCAPEAGCQFVANQSACDDGNACTEDDLCTAGSCAGQKVVCDDGNACTLDSCDYDTGCQYAALPDGVQVAGCDGLCQACVTGSCGAAAMGTDPGDDCDPAAELQAGGGPEYCQQRTSPGTCDGAGGCAGFSEWGPVNSGLQCAEEPICIADVYYALTACVDGACEGGLNELGCCGDSPCADGEHCDLDSHTCVPDGPPCQGWEYNGFCWYYDNSAAYEFNCDELCQAHGAECVLEGRLQEAVNPECTVCRHWFPNLTCSFALHDEEAKPCTYTTSKCEYANYSPAKSTCGGPKFGTNTRRFCSCTF